MKEVTVGIIGSGFASHFHSKAFSRVAGLTVRKKAIADIDIEKARTVADLYHFEEYHEDYRALLRDPEIDVIDICTPPFLHSRIAIEAIEAGKHVLCEKPLTGYFGAPGDTVPIGDTVPKSRMYRGVLDDIAAMRNALAGSDRLFMYAENYVYSPNILKAAEIIRRAMARLGLAPERARIALCAPSQSAALEAAARELSKDVRYLALCAPNGERLARTLRWDCGASVHTLQTDERIAADLSVCFDDFPLPDGLVLPLGSGAVSVAYGTENLGDAAMIWNEDQLICALYASLARRADEIWVKDVKMPPDGGENANLP